MTENISKSERKRLFKQEEEAAKQLAELSDSELAKLPVGNRVKEEIRNCRTVKAGARKRQIKYLAKVMREDSVEEILDFLTARKGSKLKKNKLHHQAERIRDLIINEAIEQQQDSIRAGEKWEPDWPALELEGFVRRYPVDAGDLRRTVYQYVKSRAQNYYRETFRIVKAAIEKEEQSRQVQSK